MFMFVHPVFLILSVSPPTFRLPTIFSLPLISLSPMSEPRSLKVSSIQLASVILCTGWIYQLWSYIPCSQTTLMPCSENTPVSQSHLGCYYGTTATKWWGHRPEIIQNCPNIPHPSRPIPAIGRVAHGYSMGQQGPTWTHTHETHTCTGTGPKPELYICRFLQHH